MDIIVDNKYNHYILGVVKVRATGGSISMIELPDDSTKIVDNDELVEIPNMEYIRYEDYEL